MNNALERLKAALADRYTIEWCRGTRGNRRTNAAGDR
jgi:hypothetical protein